MIILKLAAPMALGALFLLAACGGDSSESTPIELSAVQRSEQLYSYVMEPSPDLILNKLTKMVKTPGFNKGNFIIDNSSQWSEFWADYLEASGLNLPLPDVDFSSTTVFVTQRESSCGLVDQIQFVFQEFSVDRSQTYVSVVRNSPAPTDLVFDCSKPNVGYWTIHAVPLPNASITRDIHFEEEEEQMYFPQ